jgi:hypothetical protein
MVIARASWPNKQREAQPSIHLAFSRHTPKLSFYFFETTELLLVFWYFWLTIQNTTSKHVSNAFGLVAVFI